MKKIIKYVLAVIIVFLLMTFTVSKKEVQAPVERNGMCLDGVYQTTDFMLQEPGPGRYSYEIYFTQDGIEVWIPCTE